MNLDEKAKLGSGERFAKLKNKLSHKSGIRNPGAVAAAIGRKKYGNKRFQKLAAHGHQHHQHESAQALVARLLEEDSPFVGLGDDGSGYDPEAVRAAIKVEMLRGKPYDVARDTALEKLSRNPRHYDAPFAPTPRITSACTTCGSLSHLPDNCPMKDHGL